MNDRLAMDRDATVEDRSEAYVENRQRTLRKAANQTWLLLWARYSMIAVIPLGTLSLTAVGWVAAQLWASYQDNNRAMMGSIRETNAAVAGIASKTNDSIASLRIEMTAAISEIRNSMTMSAGTQNVINSRVDAQGRRVDQHDFEINQLKERFMINPRVGTPR